ncbi:MAG: hypothetical protein ACOY45_16995 [Pseudomonadota bacterium]
MGATAVGAVIGGAIDAMDGEDSVADGAIAGAVAATIVKVAVPLAAAAALGWWLTHRIDAALAPFTGDDGEREP